MDAPPPLPSEAALQTLCAALSLITSAFLLLSRAPHSSEVTHARHTLERQIESPLQMGGDGGRRGVLMESGGQAMGGMCCTTGETWICFNDTSFFSAFFPSRLGSGGVGAEARAGSPQAFKATQCNSQH